MNSNKIKINLFLQLVDEVTNYFEEQLNRCSTTPCMVLYVSALKTLQQQKSIPKLLSVVRKSPKKAATNAMRAIQTMPVEFIDNSVSYYCNKWN